MFFFNYILKNFKWLSDKYLNFYILKRKEKVNNYYGIEDV